MSWKKFGRSLLYPHLAIIICLLPIAVTLLVLALVYLSPESVVAILAYLLAFYVLLVICLRVPRIIQFCKTFKQENKYLQKWFSDVHLRMNVSLYGSLLWNIIFAVFQLVLGFYHQSFWFMAMFIYYVMLSVMRFFLVRHTRVYQANEATQMETKKSVFCGWMLLLMNLALAVVVTFLICWDQVYKHHMITTIAMATFTFITFAFAIVDLVRYKKYQSPVYSAAKSINLIAGCVSMLTLETAMLATFGTTESPLFRQIILAATGAAVIGFAIVMALIMIIKGSRQLKKITPPVNSDVI
ncbi:MAG: hypothetical protein IJ295_00800 [Clostridia bacterium]|nr:hypothetical protein [Clostridia bacterium]